jgi:hypothetical protein
MIVVAATENDPMAQAVVDALARQGRKDVFWMDFETVFEKAFLNFRADADGVQWSIRSRVAPAFALNSDSISAVYWRRNLGFQVSPFLAAPTSANLDAFEMFWSARWLLEALPSDLFPFGHPLSFASAENKHRQMAAALQVGFAIPATCHSNHPESLGDFIGSHTEIAVKAMRAPFVSKTGKLEDTRQIFCKSFAPQFLLEKLRKTERTQLYCQQAVQRGRDLRIMVFPHETLAAEIDTSRLMENRLDWREDFLHDPHRIVSIKPEFDHQLREFLSLMNLKAGFFDFAQPDEGPPVFFECNTNGGWLWLERENHHPVSEAVARELAR